jgi:salicylate hydroxylase
METTPHVLNSRSIVVCGGGIGGLAAALALARRGAAVRVLERAPEFGEVGAGIQLAPNASRMLDRLGVLERIAQTAVYPERIVWMDAESGEQLTALDLGEAFRTRYGYPYVVMHRTDLLTTLLDACRAHGAIVLETEKHVTATATTATGASVACADGTSYRADVVVGADGLWSSVRAEQFPDEAPPIGSTYVAYRGAIPIAEMSSHAGLDNVMLWTGKGLHLVQYPVRRGELYNQVAVFKSPTYRADSDDWGGTDELDAAYGACAEPVRTALTNIRRNRRWPMLDRLPIERWTDGRIVLLGDAAHPMLQYLAQGAAQALEDGVCFAEMLARHPADLDAGIAAYVAERAPRTARVQTLARAWGDYWHVDPGHVRTARDAALRARVADDFSDVDWFYGYDIPAEHAAAR